MKQKMSGEEISGKTERFKGKDKSSITRTETKN